MFRLYVDEVGTDDMIHLDRDEHRYLSLTGLAMRVDHARDDLVPALNQFKAKFFNDDPDEPTILHRSDIVKRKKKFWRLNDAKIREMFDTDLLTMLKNMDYQVISVMVDKKALAAKEEWRNRHPYHFLMEILIEKYVQLLERHSARGDIMPEGRRGKKDKALEAAFVDICSNGTHYVSSEQISERLTTISTLKFRFKRDNIAGQQLCDLIAHPSHIYIRSQQRHAVTIGPYARQVIDILLDKKYDRSKFGKIAGYGIKFFP